MKYWDVELILEHKPTGIARQVMLINQPAGSLENIVHILCSNVKDMNNDVALTHLEIKENDGSTILS